MALWMRKCVLAQSSQMLWWLTTEALKCQRPMRASLCTSAACALALLPIKEVLRNMPIRDSLKIHDVVIIGLVSLVCEGDLPDVG